jgi:hypothetical protein
LLVEGWVAVDHHQQLDDTLHLVQIADYAFGSGETIDGALAGGGGALFDADLASQLAGVRHGAVGQSGQVAGYEHQVAGAHGGHEVADGRIGFGNGKTHLGQFTFDFHLGILL